MTLAQVLAAMLADAKDVVKAYHGDLAHDARTLTEAAPGAVFFWTPREHGSHLIPLNRGEAVNRLARQLWEAAAPSSGDAWRLVTVGEGATCAYEPVSRIDVGIACVTASQEAEEGLSPAFIHACL